MLSLRNETFEVKSCVQGHQKIWSPTVGEEMNCVRESTNSEDPFAVAVMRRCAVVGHIP